MRQRLGICWHFFTKEVTFETWAHKELKSSTILFSHVISTFWSKWLWKRIGRSLYKPSIQNKLFQLCSKCHSNPLRVNIKPVPLKKKSHYEDCAKLSCYTVDWIETPEIYILQGSAEPSIWSSSALPLTPHRNTAECISDIPIRHCFHNSRVNRCPCTLITEKCVQMDILITR